jgi:hypothetical protein
MLIICLTSAVIFVYFIYSNRRIAQTAGRLQGLMPGDLGDLGKASLPLVQITRILDLLFGQIMSKSDSNLCMWPLTDGMHILYELTARLLACAQRMFLSAAEWNQVEDPTRSLISLIEQEPARDDFLALELKAQQKQPCPIDVFARTPFVEGVLRFLCNTSSTMAGTSSPMNDVDGTCASSQVAAIVRHMATTAAATTPESIAAALRIVAMCAFVCPTGVCWASNTLVNWNVLPPIDPKDEDDRDYLPVNACSMKDLALVIDVVSSIVEVCGVASGDDVVQIWGLHCLRALTTSSATLVILSRRNGTYMNSECLEAAWRRVWTILHRTDCRYRAFTASCGPGPKGTLSKGELVVQLLFEMVRHSCVDSVVELNESASVRSSAFIFRQQCDLWNLPVFGQVPDNCVAPFLLIYAVLSTVGLAEHGSDDIAGLSVQQASIESGFAWNRRSRLVMYCMKAIEGGKNQDIKAVSSACIGALVRGMASMLSGVLNIGSRCSDLLKSPPPLRNLDLLSDMWNSPAFEVVSRLLLSDTVSEGPDSTDRVNSRIVEMLAAVHSAARFSEFIPASQVDKLLQLVLIRCTNLFLSTENDDNEVHLGEHLKESADDIVARLSRQAMACKVVLTIMVSAADTVPYTELEWFSAKASHLFQAIVANIGVLLEMRKKFISVFGHLHGLIRAMVGFISRVEGTEWSDEVMKASSLVFDSCEALLDHRCLQLEKKYVPHGNKGVTSMEDLDTEENNQLMDPMSHPTDPSAGVHSCRKRKRRSENAAISRMDRGPPTPECAYLVASLLLALRPSPKVCELVAKTLLGVDNIGEEVTPNIDVVGGAVASTLICSDGALLFPYAADKVSGTALDTYHPSVVILLCRIIAAIRSSTSSQCKFHLFGFEICTQIVCLADSGFAKSKLSEEEARSVAGLFFNTRDSDERRSLVLQPRRRHRQLCSAVAAFRAGGVEFHEHFDKGFAGSFILRSLHDINGNVRLGANMAVAAALRLIPEDKVLESVRKRLPIFFSDAEEERASFRIFYEDKSLGCGEGFQTVEHQVWEDVLASCRYGVLNCWSEIALATSYSQTRMSCVFDLVQIASTRPNLEGLCYLMLERIAQISGHSSVDSLLTLHMEGILARWLESGTSLLDLPLSFSAPFLVRRLLRNGRIQDFHASIDSSNESTSNNTDWQKVKETAASEFVSRRSKIIFPQIVFRTVSSFMTLGVTKDYRRSFIEDDYVREVCSVFEDKYDDDVVRTLVRSHISEIFAHIAWHGGTEQNVSLEVERLVKSLLNDETVQRHGESCGHRAWRILLEVASRSSDRNAISRFVDATKTLGRALLTTLTVRSDCIFSMLGTTIEMLVFARYLVIDRVRIGHPMHIWRPMDIVLAICKEQIHQGNVDLPQLRFCFHVLAGVLIDPKLKAVHSRAFRALKNLVETSLTTAEAPNVSEMLVEILHVAFDILEQSLDSYLSFCQIAKRQVDTSLRRILGILGLYRLEAAVASDVWGWNGADVSIEVRTTLLEHAKDVPADTTAILESCRDLVDLIIENRKTARIADSDIVRVYLASELPSRPYMAHEDLHPVFGFLRNTESLFLLPGVKDNQAPTLRILSLRSDELSSLIASHWKIGQPGFSIEEKHLIDELRQLESYLWTARCQGPTASPVHLEASLLNKLGRLCSPSFPEKIRMAASCCLGEVDLVLFNPGEHGDDGRDCDDWLFQAIKTGSLLLTLQARSIEALVLSLRLTDPKVGLAAVETLRALLATRIGIECQGLISSNEALSLLKPFASQGHKALHSQLFLSENEIEEIRSTIGHGNRDRATDDWCWDEGLWRWTVDIDLPFERWICSVVTLLLICCYGEAKNPTASLSSGRKATRSFFGLCQRMSMIDPGFATRLFPSIILDLLLSSIGDQCDTNLYPVLVDTWVGNPESMVHQNISHCFTALLKSCIDLGEEASVGCRRAVELAVDTLGVLYQYTQHRFCASRSHGRNCGAFSGDPPFDESKTTRSWAGLRFGTVLRLDGLLVARACVFAGRLKSALFYAELYGESRFGGSTLALETIVGPDRQSGSPTRIGSGDISGFGSAAESQHSDFDCLVEPESGHGFLTVLRDCYSALEERDAIEAVEGSVADLSIANSQGTEFSLFAHMHHASSLPWLGFLDSSAQCARRQGANVTDIADTLENLGLNFTLESYLTGVIANYQHILGDRSMDDLSDKLYKCRLFSIPWETETIASNRNTSVRLGILPCLVMPEGLNAGEGLFHSVLFNSMTALLSDDYSACLGHVRKARTLLTDTKSLQKTHGFFGENMRNLMDRSRALNDLERIVGKSVSFSEVLSRLEHDRVEPVQADGVAVERRPLSSCVKEIAFLHLFEKARRSSVHVSKALDLLQNHLWQSYFASCKLNQLKNAGGVLLRMNAILTSFDPRGNVFIESALLKIQLEEAKLLERTSDFAGAIRSAKQTIRLLRSWGTLSADHTGLLADALLSCGKWIAKHKVEPAHAILDSYLKPGADLSATLLEGAPTTENASRASSALLGVSELASSILETVSARLKSFEWQQTGNSLKQQKGELEICEELCRKKTLNKSTAAARKSKILDKGERELASHRARLVKEISQIERERNKILGSVSRQQKLVLSSIVKALTIVGVGNGRSLSKFVYRIVDIWFSVPNTSDYADDIDQFVIEAIGAVPSFRFVPLSSQLFSRLDAESSNSESRFQERLRQLLLKLCVDHPYHCLVKLIALSNGTKIGAAVVEDAARNERVDAALNLMHILRTGEVAWVGQLVDSYQTLATSYINLAMAPTKRGDTNRIPFAAVCKKASDRLDSCLGKRSLSVANPPCVVTKPPSLRPGCDYGDGKDDPIGSERVSGFESYFTITDGGLRMPKVVVCIGSRGGRFRQLVKGNDEIRQDAIMQQVFSYVNELTAVRNHTKASQIDPRLNLVTYNIIPLSPDSGVRYFHFLINYCSSFRADFLHKLCLGSGMGGRIDAVWRLHRRQGVKLRKDLGFEFKVFSARMGI